MSTTTAKIPASIPEALSRFVNSDETALICGEERISYRELLADAGRAARALMDRGVGKGDRVALDMRRTADYLRVYLGVILAGGVQVTLNRRWPEQMREQAIRDCSPVLVLDDEGARAILDHPGDALPGLPLPELSGSDPFQIVYTSGSTGRPKGVLNCHALPLSCLYAREADEEAPMLRYLRENCRGILMDADLSFAAAAGQIFLGLLNGKALALAGDLAMQSPAEMAACIAGSGADTMLSTGSRIGRSMEEAAYGRALSGMRQIILFGEMPSRKIVDAVLEASGTHVRYAYCSSEAFYRFDAACEPGREIDYDPARMEAASVHLIEQEGLGDAPPGIPGELCISGIAGSSGRYWNDPELTGERYVEHPRYGRIFRSGDMAVREADGRIRILGRMDTMAKLHGLRIETRAIEAAMEAFPGIDRAAVLIRGEGAGAALCGYYTGSVDQGALRRHLSERLPYYMVPALLKELSELPLSLNGKLDYKALPPIEGKKSAYAPPEDPLEELLCEAFAAILSPGAPVGIDDDFFALGGDSIKGMAVAEKLRGHGFELRVEWIFASPTVRQLAPMVRSLPETAVGEEWSPQLTDGEREDIEKQVGWERVEAVFPVLSHAREYISRGSLWMVHNAWILEGNPTKDEMQGRLDCLSTVHVALRSIFVGRGTDRPLQVVLSKAKLPLFEVDLRGLREAGEDVPSPSQRGYLVSLARLLYASDPDPTGEVLFRTGLIRLSDDRTLALLFLSHLLLDAAGLGIVAAELFGGKEAGGSDAPRFRRYVGKLFDGDTEIQRACWRKLSEGSRGFARLPAGHGPRPFVLYNATSDVTVYESVLTFCRRRRVTVSALLHLLAGRVLMELLHVREVLFASVTSGRDASSAGLAGMFIGHIPILVRETDTVESVQDTILEGLACQDTGERAPSGLGLADMRGALLFNVENASAPGPGWGRPYWFGVDTGPDKPPLEAAMPPKGIDGHLTLIVNLDRQFRLSAYFSPAAIDGSFVRQLSAGLLGHLRLMAKQGME